MGTNQKKTVSEQKPQRKKLIDLVNHTYTRRIKKWTFCPACTKGKMRINRTATIWQCDGCGYSLSDVEYDGGYATWFCENCNAYLNNQEGFDPEQKTHTCRKCGHENDINENTVKGICKDCGIPLPDAESNICINCKSIRREKAKKLVLRAGILVAGAVIAVMTSSDSNNDIDESSSPNLPVGSDDEDDEVYGLGPGIFPTCKTCGDTMTGFDGWAWYTCPSCGDKVRITDGKETWYDEIFRRGKKQHNSDYSLADFCRGGDLSED